MQWIGATAEEEATDKIVGGSVIYPVVWAVEGWLVGRGAGLAAAIAFALLLIPSGLFALAWRDRLDQALRQARAFVGFLTERDLHQRLMRQRQALVEEFRALAARGRQPRSGRPRDPQLRVAARAGTCAWPPLRPARRPATGARRPVRAGWSGRPAARPGRRRSDGSA